MSESHSASKRTASQLESETKTGKTICRYGEKCYRKNPQHFLEYSHPNLDFVQEPTAKRQKLDKADSILKTGQRACFFFSKVRGINAQYNQENLSTSIRDILAAVNGELKASAQFNYMFDISWMMAQYPPAFRGKPLLIIHGDTGERKAVLESEGSNFKNVKFFQAKLNIAYGTHHSKMMLLLYEDGMRVVIHTANMVEQDWDQKTQGVWISSKFPKGNDSIKKEDEPQDEFKKDLLEYLDAYGNSDKLESWKKEIKNHDMTKAKVRIVASVPGRHTGSAKSKWGHLRFRSLLEDIGPDLSNVDGSWPVIGQFSSIGSLGVDESKWLCREWLQSLSSGRKKLNRDKSNVPSLKLVFPTVEDVRTSLEGYKAGGSLPYSDANAKRQPYLLDLFHQWKSSHSGRSRACPHIKSYTRISSQNSKAAWFLLTSANLSKAAWGAFEKNESQLMIRSYEIGVLMLPQGYNAKSEFFQLANSCDDAEDENSTSPPVLRLPYDVPLTRYAANDSPWIWDRNYTQEDSQSGLWMPRR